MTNLERSKLESFNSHAISAHKIKKGIGAVDGLMASHGQGVTFADAMYSITAQNVDAWTSTSKEEKEAQKTALVDRICKTPIQKLLFYAREKWSNNSFSKSDTDRAAEEELDNMQPSRTETAPGTDFARNIAADTAVSGGAPQAISLYYHGDPETGDGAGYIPFTDGNGNVINNAAGSVIRKIIISGDMPQTFFVPKIENAVEKLKEDFGKRLA